MIEMKKAHRETARRSEEDTKAPPDRIRVLMSEQALLDMIRTGNMEYHAVLAKARVYLVGKEAFSPNPLQNAKLGQVQFIAMCCQAAVEGGVSAESAYTIKDAYVRETERALSVEEIHRIGQTMYEKFIRLVQEQKINRDYSQAVRSTCDYIEHHLNENLTAGFLAGRVGYSDYYLSRIFKKETGISLDAYARSIRIQRAKQLLTFSDEDIEGIAQKLGFGSRNYFSATFKRTTGRSPAAYRQENRKL